MATAFRITVPTLNTMLTAFAGLHDTSTGAVIQIYTSPQPATPSVGITTQTLLASLAMSKPAFATAAAHQLVANAISDDVSVDNIGAAAWFRVVDALAGTVLYDGSVGVSNADMIVDTVDFVTGSSVGCSGYTVNLPAAAA